MKAIGIERFGGNDQLKLLSLPDPSPKPDEMLIEVKAAGVGVWDGEIRSNAWDMPVKHFPLVLGTEGAGVVRKAGSQVERFKEGDRVCFSDFPSDQHPGVWAQFACIPEKQVGHMARHQTFIEAGGFPIVALTAYQALTEALEIRAGETILLTSGSGGVGVCAIQIAKALGCGVLALASPGNFDFVSGFGADGVFDYHGDFARLLKEKVPQGVDAVLHCNWSQETGAKALAALKAGGKYVSITDLPAEVTQRGDIQSDTFMMRPDGAQLDELAKWVQDGKLNLPIQSVFRFEEARKALEQVEDGHTKGKVVLEMAEAA